MSIDYTYVLHTQGHKQAHKSPYQLKILAIFENGFLFAWDEKQHNQCRSAIQSINQTRIHWVRMLKIQKKMYCIQMSMIECETEMRKKSSILIRQIHVSHILWAYFVDISKNLGKLVTIRFEFSFENSLNRFPNLIELLCIIRISRPRLLCYAQLMICNA